MTAALRRLADPGWLPSAAVMVVLWCALWGTWSAANVLSGLTIAVVARLAGLVPSVGRVRPVPLAKLLGVVFVDLVKSTWVVATEVLTPTDYTDEAIITIDTDLRAGVHRFAVILAITLTPGTAAVGCEEGCLEVHLLHRERSDELERHVRDVVALIEAAFVVPAAEPTANPADAEVPT